MSASKPEEKRQPLQGGDEGVEQTVADAIIRLARRDAKSADVSTVAKKVTRDTDIDTIEAAFNYVWKKFPYVNDPEGVEYVTAPVHVLNGRAKYMDCDDMTTLLASILLNLGYVVVVVVISWDKGRCDGSYCPFTHVYLMVDLPGHGYMPLDPVKKDKGFGYAYAPIIRRKIIKV